MYICVYAYIYVCTCNHESNVPSRLLSQWLCDNACTWAHDVPLYDCMRTYDVWAHGDNRKGTLFS